MGLRTPKQFLEGLRDDREVYYRGQRVKDVVEHAELAAPRSTSSSRLRGRRLNSPNRGRGGNLWAV
jgi:hypothetical protein